MPNYSAALTREEWKALGVDPETGEISDIRGNGAQTHAQQGCDPQNFTGAPAKSYRRGSRKEFSKLYDLGAHAMLEMPVCKLTKAMAVLMRDATYRGICFMTPAIMASEIEVDEEYARKLLKKVEDCGFAMKIKTATSSYYLLNPHYCFAGSAEEERIARAVWARERTRRLEAERKTRKPAKRGLNHF